MFPGNMDRRPLVSRGEESPHQLPGSASSITTSEEIPERSGRQTSTATSGQSNSSGIHQQPGWDSLCPSNKVSRRAMDVVSRERHPLDSTAPSVEGGCQSRHRVESDEGLLLLDAEPIDFPMDSGPFPMARGRFICNTPDVPAPPFLQLETGHTSRSDRCIPPRLERPEGLCQSSLKPHREGVVKIGGGRGRNGPHSSNMAVSTMAPQATQPPAPA